MGDPYAAVRSGAKRCDATQAIGDAPRGAAGCEGIKSLASRDEDRAVTGAGQFQAILHIGRDGRQTGYGGGSIAIQPDIGRYPDAAFAIGEGIDRGIG